MVTISSALTDKRGALYIKCSQSHDSQCFLKMVTPEKLQMDEMDLLIRTTPLQNIFYYMSILDKQSGVSRAF